MERQVASLALQARAIQSRATRQRVEISPAKYGRLLTKVQPRVIETDEEFDRCVAAMEALDMRSERGERLGPEERALLALLERLVRDYDERIELPEVSGVEVLRHLMEHNGLTQADLLPVFKSRSVASAVLAGKRELSKAHIRALADFFHLSPAAFF